MPPTTANSTTVQPRSISTRSPAKLNGIGWSGSTVECHRAQIREFYGFRKPTVRDEDKLIFWLVGEMCPVELSGDRLREALLARCRQEKIEPVRLERLLGAAEAMFEREFTAAILGRLPVEVITQLEALITAYDPDVVGGRRSFLQELKEDPGRSSWTRCWLRSPSWSGSRRSVYRRGCSRASDKVVAGWRARAMVMYPSDFIACPRPIRVTLC